MSVILEHVSKAYGRQKALDDIGFRLEEGEICGFLGSGRCKRDRYNVRRLP